ncbi:SDR family oxidoreductase [Glutamicibacter sp. TV12E]|uniref:SDR family oxidoreductase n=1 Tax=Glutamicibacter sp. TV12E TaxID=3446362 RepID=UPI004034D55F
MKPLALVTGASSGIGRQAALSLAQSGHRVIVGYGKNHNAAEQTAAEIRTQYGVWAETEQIQLDEPEQTKKCIDSILGQHGPVDVLVNNAGINRRESFLTESITSWNRLLDVNLTSPFVIAQRTAKAMVEEGIPGRIINVTSVHQRIPITGGSSYCVAKAGLGMLTQSMALELGEYGITANAVAPGETATPMNSSDPNYTAYTVSRPVLPIPRPGDPKDVAQLITFLTSPAAGYVTGQTFVIDGGLELIAADANVRSVLN